MSQPSAPPRDRVLARDGSRGGPAALRTVVVALALVLALAGCGLRVATPAPTEPVPDATEVVRRRTVDDALALDRAARPLAALPESGAAAGVLIQVADFAAQHVVALGGEYDSGLEEAESSSTPASAPSPTALPDAASVLTLLSTSAGRAHADAGTVTDGALARLLASVATSRARLLADLAAALGVESPGIAVPVPDAPVVDGSTPTDPAATATATDTSGTSAEPVRIPDLPDLVLAEDEAAYALEVVAAKLDEPGRSRAVASAAAHRDRAAAWADALDTGIADPRRAVYALPTGLDDPAVSTSLVVTLETSLTARYASAIAEAAAGSRSDLIAALLVADGDAAAWGAPTLAFPGLPEQIG